ncbi:hypothetical protein GCM10010123_10790 [Pilimelia anulata]|uniref:GGDEF domain-containing protein n=1 Tax=Pilimelia anulata TaxID=53371 RepID=A0A8J3B0H8_9ACTN|nr:GGDEF domain-containing protein [Pilimelia anulata]GGJ82986.1 hypothetical protein GCM10010123_10790 [Pilimelia anulata]
MENVPAHAVRLLEEAQTGGVAEVLPRAEELLRARTGELADGPAAYHFVRAVCFAVLHRHREGIAAGDLVVAAAEREGAAGWRSCGLSLRAELRLRLGECELGEYDVDAVLRDLAAAEAALGDGEPDPVVAGNAYTGVALGYHQLRLYELAEPQYRRAYEVSTAAPVDTGNPSMWLTNLAMLHLQWALELYQIGEQPDGDKHVAEAQRYAERAVAEAAGPAATGWRLRGLVYAASARAFGDDPAGAAADLAGHLAELAAREDVAELELSQPCLAVALHRSGRPDEAMAVLDEAIASVPEVEWLTLATAYRTRAVLLREQGSPGAAAGLAYGDRLAAALWRQRQRTLQAATTMVSYETLRAEHERIARAAGTDPLTGVANRRGFDEFVDALVAQPAATAPALAALVIDVDKLKLINDVSGHNAGDSALRAIARAIADCLRDGDAVARLGGDEFAALLPGTDPAVAAGLAARMVDTVRAIPGCPATLSVGVAGGPAHLVRETLERADRAMYVAKRAGGDRVAPAT